MQYDERFWIKSYDTNVTPTSFPSASLGQVDKKELRGHLNDLTCHNVVILISILRFRRRASSVRLGSTG